MARRWKYSAAGMMYLRWLSLALLGIVATILNVVLSPILPFFIRAGQYPKWLSWFQTADSPAWGDEAFHINQMAWTDRLPTALALHIRAMFWALRNPAYGYDDWAGVTVLDGFQYSHKGREDVNIGRDVQGMVHLTEGTLTRSLVNGDGNRYFEYTKLYRWNAKRAWRITFGWHLHPELKVGAKRLLRVTINPWMDCTK